MVICPGGGYGSLMSGPRATKSPAGSSATGWPGQSWISPAAGAGPCRWTPSGPSARCGPAPPSGTSTQSGSASSASAAGTSPPARARTSTPATQPPRTPSDRASCRPDFMVLIYPVITLGTATHAGTKQNLLAPAPKPELVERFSNEKQATARTPPAFLAHARDDSLVSPQNSRDFFAEGPRRGGRIPGAALRRTRTGRLPRPDVGPLAGRRAWLAGRAEDHPAAAARPAENGR